MCGCWVRLLAWWLVGKQAWLRLRGREPPASIGKPHTVSAFDLKPSVRRGESDGIVNVVEAKAISNIVRHDPTTGSLVRCGLLGGDKESARRPIGRLILQHFRPRCVPDCVQND
jgi:hypothetical protein